MDTYMWDEEVSNLQFAPVEFGVDQIEYALLITSVGYESRALHIASNESSVRFSDIWAIEYADNQDLHYEDNHAWFERAGTVLPDVGAELEDLVRKRLERFIQVRSSAMRALDREHFKIHVAIDISCMNRDRMAMVARAVLDHPRGLGVLEVDFLYSPADYNEDFRGSEGGIVVNRPIIGLDGWTLDPNAPVTCIIGAGFESRLAMAAIETLEPLETIWLFPRGMDGRYDEVTEKRNYESAVSAMDHVGQYGLVSPFRLATDLQSTVSRLLVDSRVVVVPLGPKIFAICAILVAMNNPIGVTVWRLSADTDRKAEDRVASGPVIGLRARRSTAK